MVGESACIELPLRLLAKTRLLPKRADILARLPKGGVFVEIGVALGDYSAAILKVCQPDMFVAIDIFTIDAADMIWGKPTKDVLKGGTHEQFYRKRFGSVIAEGRMQVMAGDSSASLSQMADGSIDIAYVDADHSYQYVRKELALLNRKVKAAGWIVLNDYTMGNVTGSGFKRYGVIQATHEFMIAENWEMVFLALHPKMYCDVALRRASLDVG